MYLLYARVSKAQASSAGELMDPENQMRLLRSAVEAPKEYQEFIEKSSAVKQRPVWERLVGSARPGDVVVVWKLDRVFRSVQHAANTLADFEKRGVAFKTLTEGFDTTTSGGRLMFNVLAAVAQFERDLIVERTHAGLARARAAGKRAGWPTGLRRQGRRGKALRTAGAGSREDVELGSGFTADS